MSDQIRINGNVYSWSSVYLKVGGERFYGFKSISYADSRERVKAYGSGRHHAPRGRSAGKYATEPVAVTFEKETAQALRDALAAKASDGVSYGNVEFQIVVQFVEGSRGITDEIEDCVWTKNASSSEEGPDPLYDEVEFDCMRIRRNGKTLFDSTEGSP